MVNKWFQTSIVHSLYHLFSFDSEVRIMVKSCKGGKGGKTKVVKVVLTLLEVLESSGY